MFSIVVHEVAEEDLDQLRTFDRRVLEDAMDEQLSRDPLVATRKRKPLHSFVPAWEHIEPIWELRVGGFRVFYDVDEHSQIVHVRRILAKGTKNTGDLK
jgi:mRNA-degrading endonuclease RelE of RelBE toxin-antitoxin system